MTEYGQVIAVDGEFATVRIGRNSACGSCGKCGMTEQQKHVDFFAANVASAKVGDRVEIQLPEVNTTKLAFVGYILPLLPALAALFAALLLVWADWLAILLFFVGYAIGFAVVALLDKAKKHKWTEQATVVRVVGGAQGSTEQPETAADDSQSANDQTADEQ